MTLIRTLDRAESLAVLHDERLCVLSLVDGDEPYAVPVYYGFDGVTLFLGLSEGKKIRVLERNPRALITITSVRPDGDWRSVQIRADVAFVTDPEERRRAIDVLIAHNRRVRQGTTQAAAPMAAPAAPGRIASVEVGEVTGRARG